MQFCKKISEDVNSKVIPNKLIGNFQEHPMSLPAKIYNAKILIFLKVLR